jgi:valyl-tRNA synthetase
MAAFVLETILKLLHPISPFITEELWAATSDTPRASLLITAPWPELPNSWHDAAAVKKIDDLIDAVREGRSVRTELNVPPGARPDFYLVDATAAQRDIFKANASVLAQTLRTGELYFDRPAPIGAIRFVDGGRTYALDVKDLIDIPAERARLAKDIAAHAANAAATAKKLDNADFVARAPEEVVDENRARLADALAAKTRLEGVLARLEGLG